MSLTREEWVAMWNTVKRLEYLVAQLRSKELKGKATKEIFYLKAQIQSVIGQME